jgi:hypothetical protein
MGTSSKWFPDVFPVENDKVKLNAGWNVRSAEFPILAI